MAVLGLIFSALATVFCFGWHHPILFFGLLSGLYLGYRYALRKYNQRLAIQKYRL